MKAGSIVDWGSGDETIGGVGTMAKVEPRKMTNSLSVERFILCLSDLM